MTTAAPDTSATPDRARPGRPRGSWRVWTAERIAEAQALRRRGASGPEIAARFGCTAAAVYGALFRAARPGYRRRPATGHDQRVRCTVCDAPVAKWAERIVLTTATDSNGRGHRIGSLHIACADALLDALEEVQARRRA